MAKITTNTMENKNLTETVCADGTACMRLTANLNGNPAGACNINIIPTDQTVYQQSKEEIRSAIDDFITDVLDQAQAQEYVSSESTAGITGAKVAEAEAETESSATATTLTAGNKSRSKKS